MTGEQTQVEVIDLETQDDSWSLARNVRCTACQHLIVRKRKHCTSIAIDGATRRIKAAYGCSNCDWIGLVLSRKPKPRLPRRCQEQQRRIAGIMAAIYSNPWMSDVQATTPEEAA